VPERSRAAKKPKALRAAIEHLETVGAKFALIGGIAVGARSAPRFTGDVGIAVSTAEWKP